MKNKTSFQMFAFSQDFKNKRKRSARFSSMKSSDGRRCQNLANTLIKSYIYYNLT